MTQLYLYDDPADVPNFYPFTQSRPIGELRYGAHLLRERAAIFGLPVSYTGPSHLCGFTEPEAPGVQASPSDKHAIYLRSSFLLDPGQQDDIALPASDGTATVRLVDGSGATIGAFMSGRGWKGPVSIDAAWPAATLHGKLLPGIWQIIADLVPALRADLEAEIATREQDGRIPAGCTVLGDASQVLIDAAAVVEPLVVFDVRTGPVWVRAGAEGRATTRLQGPLVVGEGSRVVGGQLRESSIGPKCVVHGEVSNSIFLGYANKSHDGFLGHSVVGRWANIGAGTITSNLKNTYGNIRLNLGTERVETGMQFLGSLIGDHVKTAIGTMLPTGCVIGTGANLFGTKRPESHVPAFAWGTDEPGRLLACRMFLQTAAKVLPRRDIAFDGATKAYLESVWKHCTGQPCE